MFVFRSFWLNCPHRENNGILDSIQNLNLSLLNIYKQTSDNCSKNDTAVSNKKKEISTFWKYLFIPQRIGSFFWQRFFSVYSVVISTRMSFSMFSLHGRPIYPTHPSVFDNHAIIISKWSFDLFPIDFVSARWLIIVFRRTPSLTDEAYTYYNTQFWPLISFTRRYYLSVMFDWHNIRSWRPH